MGKQKRQRSRPQSNPIARKDEKTEKLRQEKILPLIANLKSPKPTDRAVAISAINAMADDAELRQMLLKEKLLQVILSNSLSDNSQEIVAEAYGLLRNIVIEEGRDVAVFLFRQDIVTSIAFALKGLSNVWATSLSTLKGQDKDTVLEFVENVFGLISALSMADVDIADAIIAKLGSDVFSFAIITLNGSSTRVAETAYELMYTLTEDNAETVQILSKLWENPVDSPVKSTVSSVYKFGVLFNLHSVIGLPLVKIFTSLLEAIAAIDLASLAPPAAPESDSPADVKKYSNELIEVRARVNAIQVAFEIFAVAMEAIAEEADVPALEFANNYIVTLAINSLSHSEFTLRALSFLNNLGWAFVANEEAQWSETAEKIWVATLPLLANEDLDVVSSTCGVLGSISKSFADSVSLDDTAIDALLARVEKTRVEAAQNEDLKEQWIQLVQNFCVLLATLGSVPGRLNLTMKAGSLLFAILDAHAEASPELLVETLNTLFELFGDNESEYNRPIYIEGNLNAKLQSLQPGLKRTLKSVEKSKQPALREAADEALMNLGRFIQYKNEVS